MVKYRWARVPLALPRDTYNIFVRGVDVTIIFLVQSDAKAAQQKKKDDDDRAHGRQVSAAVSEQRSSFWANMSSTPCFLPAVTDVETEGSRDNSPVKGGTAYSAPPRYEAAQNAFVSGDSSLRNRAFVSKSTNGA